MRIERALAIRDRLRLRVADLYSTAILCGYPAAEITAAFIHIRNDQPAGCPRWVFDWLDGYRSALDAGLYESHLIYGGFLDGVFYSVQSHRPDYYGKHGISAERWGLSDDVDRPGHYWDRSYKLRNGIYDRGSFKPFFPYFPEPIT